MKRHGLKTTDWTKYALVICYGDHERVLGYDEKPVAIFRELKEMDLNPSIMLRQVEEPDDDPLKSDGDFGFDDEETPGGRL
ncbi:unnamed protein product [[Candida] boidinii]|nr:unnamed protein product [[Candida] boidinii]